MNTNSDHLTGTADQDVPAHSPAGSRLIPDPACSICKGSGRYCVGYSGRDDDGNAPLLEDCDCFIPADADWQDFAEWAEHIDLIRWAYSKLHHINFTKQDDALMLDRMKLLLEHGR